MYMRLICSYQLASDDNVNRRWVLVRLIRNFNAIKLGHWLFLLRVIFIELVLVGLRIIHQWSDHFVILYKSLSISLIESAFSITVNKDESSANSRMLHLTFSAIFINIEVDLWTPLITCCFRFDI